MKLMKSYPLNRSCLQKSCIGRLQELVLNTTWNINMTMSGVKVVDLIFNVMKNHQTNTAIQIRSCEILNHVLYYEESTMEKNVGNINLALTSMRIRSASPYFQARASFLVANLACNSDANTKAITNVGGIDLALTAMRNHSASP